MHADRSADQCRLVYSNTLDMITPYTVAGYLIDKYQSSAYKVTATR